MPLHQAPIPSQLFAEEAKKRQQFQKLREKQFPPPISFTQCYGSVFGDTKGDGKDDVKVKTVEITIHSDPNDDDSPVMKKPMEVFEKGNAYKYCHFRETLDQLWTDLGIEGQPLKQYQVIQQLTSG